MERAKLNMIMEAMEGTSIRECEVNEKNSYLKIVRSNVSSKKVSSESSVPVSSKSPEVEIIDETTDITSHWIGYFYRGVKKGDKPVVKLRDTVKKGDQVGIVVTMNVVHNIISEIDGKLVDVLVEDGDAVQYGQPIMRLE